MRQTLPRLGTLSTTRLTILMNLVLVVVVVEAKVVEAKDRVVARELRATPSVTIARRRATIHEIVARSYLIVHVVAHVVVHLLKANKHLM